MIRTRKSKKFRRKPAQILFAATVGDNTLHLRSQVNGYDCTIYWGDGSSSICPTGGGNIIHNYAAAGNYLITISGNSFAGFYVANQVGKEKYKALYSLGKWKNDTMVSCQNGFYRCSALNYIGDDAFRYVSKITAVHSCFFNCTSLTAIPANIFKYNRLINVFTMAFKDCTKLSLRDDIFGLDYASRFALVPSVSFTDMFTRSSFSGTQGIAPQLWDFALQASTKTNCFGGAGNNLPSLKNYPDVPTEWRT